VDPEWSWKESLGPLPHAAHRAPHLGSPLHFLTWMKSWKKKNEEKEDKKEERKMNQKKRDPLWLYPAYLGICLKNKVHEQFVSYRSKTLKLYYYDT